MRRDTFLKSLAALAAVGSLPLPARAAVAIHNDLRDEDGHTLDD